MITCPSYIALQFDPFKQDMFQDKVFLVIWCYIACQHLKDQYFNYRINRLTKFVRKKQPKDYQTFKRLAIQAGLSQYGQVCTNEGAGIFVSPAYQMSDPYWSGLWRLIKKHLQYNEIQMTLKLFPDEVLTIRTPDGYIEA